ncbi:MAG: hypothetical protein JO363_07150, partial [Solirubrobacterales bacterium]|nr:hypothetical protein [Solirubrobacterales bacterium]
FDEHGEWPEEEQRKTGRRWSLAPGVRTLEDEAHDPEPHDPEPHDPEPTEEQ